MKDISLYERVPPIENNFSIKFRVYNSEMLKLYWHEHLELLYFVRGGCEFFADGHPFTVREGDLVVVNSAELHSFKARGKTEFFSFLIYPSFFSDISFSGVIIQNLITNDEKVKEYMNDIYEEYMHPTIASDMMMKAHTYKLMAHLVRNYTKSVISKRDMEKKSLQIKRLDGILEYISNNYQEKITTKTLSENCYVSEEYFCRFFKKAIGKSATEYINEYRIEKATVLLRNTDESISGIAASVGFDDVNYFSRVFKRIKGINPGKYRNEK